MFVSWSSSLNTLSARFGDRPAAIDMAGESLSFRQLCTYAHALASYLNRGDHLPGKAIASLLPNSVQAVWASYGIRMNGAAETPLSWGYTLDEIQWCAKLAGFDSVITKKEREDELRSIGLQTIDIDTLAASPEFKTLHSPLRTLPAIAGDQAGRILFTSGTTGKPKGVRYSHAARWMGEQLLKAEMPFIPSAGEQILLMTPFVHGASLLTYAWCDFGGTIIIHPGVHTDRIEPLLNSNSLSAIFAPPTVLAKITSAFEGRHFDGIKCVFTGTQPLASAMYRRAAKMFGPNIRITYGKSECVNPIAVLDRAQTQRYFDRDHIEPGACVGWPAPGVEIKIVHPPADASVSAEPTANQQEDGEIYLRSPHMSSGLITETGFAPHAPEGWHQTGDLGHFDQEGRLVLTGRVADVIKTGGYRVNPDEIEAQLTHNTLCAQICVTSIASDYWGEIIIAVAEGEKPGWEDLCGDLLKDMSKHKRPRHFIGVESLPRNPQGKISRKQVARQVLERFELRDGPYPELIKKAL